jgi:hypothetical protein
MKSPLRFALLIPLAALLGCGVNPSSTNPTTPSGLTGNWVAGLSIAIINAQVVEFVGALQFSGGSISGTLTPVMPASPIGALGHPCTPPEPIAVTGSIDINNSLTVSLPIGGGTATMTAAIASNPETPASGSFQIVGGTCAQSATPMTIAEYAPVTGTYTGTLASNINNGTSFVTAVLTQSTIPNSSGAFPLAGTVTVTGQCNTSFVVSSSYSSVEGNSMTALSDVSSSLYASLSGRDDPTASTVTTALFEESLQPNTICNGQYGGTLTRQ